MDRVAGGARSGSQRQRLLHRLGGLPAEGQVVMASLGIGGAQINLPGGVEYLEANVGLAVRFREAPATIIGVPRREIASRLAA